MRVLTTITSKHEGYIANIILDDDGSVFFVGDADIDADGGPNYAKDKYGQPDTALHLNGKPVNSEAVPFIVLPPEVIKSVKGIVLGCKAIIRYNGREVDAVVADEGPRSKLGEISIAAAEQLMIDADPNSGGVSEQEVMYWFRPGSPATINGVLYALQPYAKRKAGDV